MALKFNTVTTKSFSAFIQFNIFKWKKKNIKIIIAKAVLCKMLRESFCIVSFRTSSNWTLQVETCWDGGRGVVYDTLWLGTVRLTCLASCRFGPFPAAWVLWLVSWPGSLLPLRGSTIIASSSRTSASDAQKNVCVNVTVRVFLVFLLYSFNFILIIIIYCEHSLRLLTERQFYSNARLHFVHMEAEYATEDFWHE